MDVVYNFLADYVNVLLWDYFLTYGLLFAGLYFSIRFGFPQITRMWEAFKQVFGKLFNKDASQEGSMSSFQALATAIAAQVGTGNVAGVATAILGGGPGAIFWMWVSAFLGMGTIFNEAILAQVYRMRDRNKGDLVGGPAYYLSKGVGSNALAKFFSVSLIVALGFIGNMVQSNSIASAVTTAFAIPEWVTGFLVALAAILIFAGGMKRIASFAEFVVPIMALVYIVSSLVILFLFRDNVVPALKMIFVGAFSPQAAIGGIAGASVRAAVQKGVARGLFSNEAGMGSTPHAHAVAHADQATAHFRRPIDPHPTLVATPHPADGGTRRAVLIAAKRGDPEAKQCRGDRGGGADPARHAVDADGDVVGHAAASSAGIDRSGRNGAGSTGGVVPSNPATIRSAVPGAMVMPRPSCPAAIQTPGIAGHGPIRGSLSAVAGRKPTHVCRARSCARAGR